MNARSPHAHRSSLELALEALDEREPGVYSWHVAIDDPFLQRRLARQVAIACEEVFPQRPSRWYALEGGESFKLAQHTTHYHGRRDNGPVAFLLSTIRSWAIAHKALATWTKPYPVCGVVAAFEYAPTNRSARASVLASARQDKMPYVALVRENELNAAKALLAQWPHSLPAVEPQYGSASYRHP